MWRLLEEEGTDVFKNLALEEAIARVNAEQEEKINTLRFWRADCAVILGRFQCVHKEIDIAFCQKNDIAIARRFTGGGTVFHDIDNLNFAICLDQNKPYVNRTLNELYWNFIGGIATALQEIGIPAIYDSYRSCLRINGKKVTGTAGWLKHGVSFIHGTLLIDSDLEIMRNVLKVPSNQPVYLRDNRRIRCLESKRDSVTTIAREVTRRPSDDEIKSAIINGLEKLSGEDIQSGNITEQETERAESLYQSQYSQPEWNLGTLEQDEK
ncbi:MAG: biotin/lipoate A/B protein ligase family protein [Candidatus Thorarchaeota archaeon]